MVRNVAVIGAGVIGGAIAMCLVESGKVERVYATRARAAASSVRLIDNYKEASILKVRKINYAFFLFIPLFVLAGIIEIGLLPFF